MEHLPGLALWSFSRLVPIPVLMLVPLLAQASVTNPIDNLCSASPAPTTVCTSSNGENAITFYPDRAYDYDFYDGLNSTVFCNQGYLKINGVALQPGDFTVHESVSDDNGLVVGEPFEAEQSTRASCTMKLLKVRLSTSFFFSSGLMRSLDIVGGAALLSNDSKTATLYIENATNGVVDNIRLNCFQSD